MQSHRTYTFPLAVFLLYALVSGILLWHHEPWRDELQCWEIARQSATLPELFHNARYEGHPSAWYLLLFAITRLTPDFAAVQWLHWLLALASVALVLWRSPFGRWQRALLVFGYFFLFEYGALTRNYALGVLLTLGICSLLRDWRRHWLAISALLFVLMQCNMFALLLAGALFVPLFFQGIMASKKGEMHWKHWVLGGLVVALGLLLSGWDMAPPSDTNYAVAWKWASPDWKPALGAFFRAMLPLPPWEMHGWGHHVLEKLLDWEQRTTVECIGAAVLLLGCFWSLRKSPFALAFFGLAWLGISLFLAVKFQGYIRHHGHFYLAWVMALWIERIEGMTAAHSTIGVFLKNYFAIFQKHPKHSFLVAAAEPPLPKKKKILGAFCPQAPSLFFTIILLIQLISAVPVAYFDLRYPFSQSQNVAAFLRQHHLEGRFLVGDYDYATSPVAFHLRRPIYYPNQMREGSFLLWNKEQAALRYDNIVPVAMGLHKAHGDFLLLTSYPIPAERLNDSIRVVQAFYPAIEGSEEYYLYGVGE